MPRSRGQFSRGNIRAPQRQIANFAITAELDGLVTSSAATVKGAFTVGLALTEAAATLVRTRGMLAVRVAAAAAGNSITRGALGMIVVSQDAFDIGLTALPGPLSDSQNDWFLWVPFTLMHDDQLAEFDSKFVASVPFDSRGMRKLKFGDVLAAVLEVDSDLSGSALDAALVLRTQTKL